MRTSTVDAHAELRAAQVDGRTRCTTMRSSPPLTFRATPEGMYLVGSAAGPLGGDSLHVAVHVGAGASLVVRSAAATVALPGAHGEPSVVTLDVQVDAGGTLRWLPEPLVLAACCDHRVTTRARLEEGATLVLREHVVLGRHDESPGSLLHRMRVDVGPRPLLRNDLRLGSRWPAADGPAGADGARRVRQTLLVNVDPDDSDQLPGARVAEMDLGDGAWMVSELLRATDATTVSARK